MHARHDRRRKYVSKASGYVLLAILAVTVGSVFGIGDSKKKTEQQATAEPQQNTTAETLTDAEQGTESDEAFFVLSEAEENDVDVEPVLIAAAPEASPQAVSGKLLPETKSMAVLTIVQKGNGVMTSLAITSDGDTWLSEGDEGVRYYVRTENGYAECLDDGKTLTGRMFECFDGSISDAVAYLDDSEGELLCRDAELTDAFTAQVLGMSGLVLKEGGRLNCKAMYDEIGIFSGITFEAECRDFSGQDAYLICSLTPAEETIAKLGLYE